MFELINPRAPPACNPIVPAYHDMGRRSSHTPQQLRELILEAAYDIIEMHGLFQMKYYAHFYGRDPHGHLAYKDHPWYDACMHFCEHYDQSAFDPAYPTKPLSHFEPLLRAIFARTPFDPAVLKERLAEPAAA